MRQRAWQSRPWGHCHVGCAWGRAALLAGDQRRARRTSRARLAGVGRGERARVAGVTTHILDVGIGRPAQGVRVELYDLGGGSGRTLVADVTTNADGRTDKPLISADAARAGQFELAFHVGDYFRSRGVQLAEPAVPRYRPDPLRRRRPSGALPCAPARLAVELFDLSGKLRRRTEGWVGRPARRGWGRQGGREGRLDVQGTAWRQGPDAGHADHLGFLGAWPFPRQNSRYRGLDFLGFPWILLVRIETYQWVTRDFR